MKILVTGGKGYIGEYIVRELKKSHTVVVIDNQSKGHHPAYSDSFDGVQVIYGDCADLETMHDAMMGVDIVIAGAALIGGIKYFHDIPYRILAENNEITDVTLRSAAANNVKQVIMISSSMVYESAIHFPVVEGDELSIPPPITSYGFQKLSTEYYVRAAAKELGLDYTIVRPFNAAGPGEWSVEGEPGYSHVLPDFLLKMKQYPQTGSFEILGNGFQIRCLTHCRDIARGIGLCIAHPNAFHNDFNFVNFEQITMQSLAELVMKKAGYEKVKFAYTSGYPYDVKRRVGFGAKAQDILGWVPEFNVEAIVDDMLAYYQINNK